MVNQEEQLRITRKGEIMLFKDRSNGKTWCSQMRWIRLMVYGKRSYYYAGKYIPLPIGTNRFNIEQRKAEREEATKNKIVVAL